MALRAILIIPNYCRLFEPHENQLQSKLQHVPMGDFAVPYDRYPTWRRRILLLLLVCYGSFDFRIRDAHIPSGSKGSWGEYYGQHSLHIVAHLGGDV